MTLKREKKPFLAFFDQKHELTPLKNAILRTLKHSVFILKRGFIFLYKVTKNYF